MMEENFTSEEITLEAIDENLQAANDFLNQTLESWNAPMKVVMQFELCLEEMYINVCHYAYKDMEVGDVTMIMERKSDHAVALTLIDSGTPYDPLSRPDPDTSLSVEERGIGGLGIYLTKKNMTECSYEYKDGKNMFTMVKEY